VRGVAAAEVEVAGTIMVPFTDFVPYGVARCPNGSSWCHVRTEIRDWRKTYLRRRFAAARPQSVVPSAVTSTVTVFEFQWPANFSLSRGPDTE